MRLLAFLLIATVSAAQQLPARRTIRSIGEGSATASPDQARIVFSAQSEARTASEAATSNASVASRLMTELRRILGGNAEVRVIGYTLSQAFATQRPSPPPVQLAYVATTTVQAVVRDLNALGSVVDAGIRAGGTLAGVTLGYRDEDSVKAQALRVAGQKARAKAEAIAQGLGLRLGSVVLAQEVPVVEAGVGGVGAAPALPDLNNLLQLLPLLRTGDGAVRLEVRLTVEFEIIP
ncbi:MAG: SIMPL domain-containing protein [Bryobacteraceae bacterium]|nr:SIMPL domain-containing protein [Bryobacteraceae bacterium]